MEKERMNKKGERDGGRRQMNRFGERETKKINKRETDGENGADER